MLTKKGTATNKGIGYMWLAVMLAEKGYRHLTTTNKDVNFRFLAIILAKKGYHN